MLTDLLRSGLKLHSHPSMLRIHKIYSGQRNCLLELIQGICKHPTYWFEHTTVWERWHFWRCQINIDYVWYSASEVFVHLSCPSSNLVYRSLKSTLRQDWGRPWPTFVLPNHCNANIWFMYFQVLGHIEVKIRNKDSCNIM